MQRIETSKKTRGRILLSIIVIYYFLSYLHSYYVHYPKTNIPDWGGGYKQVVEESSKYNKEGFKIVIDENLKPITNYYNFYTVGRLPNLEIVSENWIKPKDWGPKPVLYIRPYYGVKFPHGLVENIILPNQNHDIYAQFYRY